MFVSVGDIEKYAFCSLSWWLSREHKVVEKEGVYHHGRVEKELESIKEKEKKAKFYEKYILFFSLSATFVAIAGIAFLYGRLTLFWKYFMVVLALLWLLNSSFFLYRASKVERILMPRYEKLMLLSSMGAIIISTFSIIFSTKPNEDVGRFAEILALIWVVVANIFFYRYLFLSDDVLVSKIKYVPLRGEVEYVGRNRKGEELASKKYGIRGTPDYIIKIDEDYIPVEEKSADLYSPSFPHVIQITAYCMLVEDKYGIPPPYGILKYKNAQFKIPYERRWKNMVMEIKENILRDLEKGMAHRNHENTNKCRRCNHREHCPESLL